MIEFALTAPALFLTIIGGLEVINYALAQMRVSQIAMTVADNAGRIQTGVDESDIYQTFEGANMIGKPMSFKENGKIVLSSIEDNGLTGASNGQYIRWQRCYGDLAGIVSNYGVEGTGKSNSVLASGVGPTGRKIKASTKTAIMFVEVTYKYQPLTINSYLPIDKNIRYEIAFNVRGRVNQVISNTASRVKLTC